eukprot:13451369-Alexandrium_andersonii.AAC.1
MHPSGPRPSTGLASAPVASQTASPDLPVVRELQTDVGRRCARSFATRAALLIHQFRASGGGHG